MCVDKPLARRPDNCTMRCKTGHALRAISQIESEERATVHHRSPHRPVSATAFLTIMPGLRLALRFYSCGCGPLALSYVSLSVGSRHTTGPQGQAVLRTTTVRGLRIRRSALMLPRWKLQPQNHQ